MYVVHLIRRVTYNGCTVKVEYIIFLQFVVVKILTASNIYLYSFYRWWKNDFQTVRIVLRCSYLF